MGLLALLAGFALLAPAPAEAQSVNVSNLSQSQVSQASAILSVRALANAFTTGGTSTDRYTLNNVVLDLTTFGSGQLDVSIHAAGTGTNASNPGTKIGSSLVGTISSSAGNTTYTASGIILNGGTTYFVRLAPSSGAGRATAATTSDAEASTFTTGWSIGNDARFWDGTSWSDLGSGRFLRLTVNATTGSATVSPPTLITSVLTRVDYASVTPPPPPIRRDRPAGTAAWNESIGFVSGHELAGVIRPGTVTCTTGTAEIGWYKSTALTTQLGCYGSIGLASRLSFTPTAAGEYRALAYCRSGSTYSSAVNLMRGGAVTLTGPTLTASNMTQTGARLTIANHSSAWWYKQTAPSDGTCTSRTSAQTTADLTSLTANTSYTYKAYSASGCMSANEIASRTFRTTAATRI